MMSTKSDRVERYMLKGSLRKNGFDRWRLVTSAFSRSTGEEKVFFLEYLIINPALSPKECVLGLKDRSKKSAQDLQYALTGSNPGHNIEVEEYVQPSYGMVKAGFFGVGGVHINSFYPTNQVEVLSKDFIVRFSGKNPCTLLQNGTTGTVELSSSDLRMHPEYMCDSGSITWNLRFDKKIGFNPFCKTKNINWSCFGAYSVFAGRIVCNGEEYEVNPARSFGYVDKKWGKEVNSPLFHLHSSNLISSITGKPLTDSCFAVEGDFDGRLSIHAFIDGKCIEFKANRKHKDFITYECTEMPEDDDGVKLHWTVSAHNKNYILDIDVYCNTDAMYVRDYECTEGKKKKLQILGGGMGLGGIKLFQKNHRNLELLEEARINNCVCEYGNIEFPEK